MEVMAKNAEEISNYTFNAGDELLLDANVWFFVYGPHRPGDPRASVYSGALAKILAAKTRIYIDVLIISEFIKRLCTTKTQHSKRSFRYSERFQALSGNVRFQTDRRGYCGGYEKNFDELYVR
jgi:hypothetical protein